MNKGDFVSILADELSLTKADAGRFIDGFIATLQTALQQSQEVRIVGFGTFSVSKRAARKGRNPRTGATINIKASKQVKFKPGKTLKDAIN